MKTLKLFYFKYLSGQNSSWNYFIRDIFSSQANCMKTLENWENHSFLKFTPKSYSHLLQLSLFKNYHKLSIHLLKNKEIVYPFNCISLKEKVITKTMLLDNLMTNNLYEKDHAAWLGLMSFHHPFHLMGFNWDYNCEQYLPVVYELFNHPALKHLFLDKERQKIILELCHTKAKEMIYYVFLDLSLDNKSYAIEPKHFKI